MSALPWLAVLLLLGGCEAVYGGLKVPNPEDCTVSGCAGADQVCDQGSHQCRSRAAGPRFTVTVSVKLAEPIVGSVPMVSSEPAGIGCPGTCSATFPADSRLDLVPKDGDSICFTGWDGPCDVNGGGVCSFSVTKDVLVTARYRRCVFDQQKSEVASDLIGVWVAGAGEAWIVGQSKVLINIKNAIPMLINTIMLPDGAYVGISGFQDSVWVATDKGAVFRRRLQGGVQDSAMIPDTKGLTGIVAVAADQAVVSGRTGLVFRNAPGTMTFQQVATPTVIDLLGVWANGPGNIWTAGGPGGGGKASPIFNITIRGVAPLDSMTTRPLRGVYGSGDNDVWFVGDQVLLRSSGAAVRELPGAAGVNLRAVWARSSDDAWAVGEGGAVLHWNGAGWGRISTGARGNLNAVSGTALGEVWVVGDGGVVLVLRP